MRSRSTLLPTVAVVALTAVASTLTPTDAAAQELRPLEVNLDQLVEMAALGEIRAPTFPDPPYRIAPDGTVLSIPGTSSIVYNFRVGDTAIDMAGDHIEPGVSMSHPSPAERHALNVLAQIGNEVRIVSGEARGAVGTVIGKHGGIDNVMVEFPDAVYDDLVIGDRMQVRAIGLGMEPTNAEGIAIRNMSPRLLEALTAAGMGLDGDGMLQVPVTHLVPAKIMGSGLGRNHVVSGDYDIQMFDEGVNERYNLNSLRMGDIVAIIDADNTHGRIFLEGAVTIGVISHGKSRVAGHGPGVTALLTSAEGRIIPVMDPDSNLATLLNLR